MYLLKTWRMGHVFVNISNTYSVRACVHACVRACLLAWAGRLNHTDVTFYLSSNFDIAYAETSYFHKNITPVTCAHVKQGAGWGYIIRGKPNKQN